MKIIEIKNKDEFEKEVLKSSEPVLVDFNADWCGPCQMLKPTMESIASDGIKVVSVNTDLNEELSLSYGVMSIPCIVYFKDGKEIKRTIGLQSKDDILEIMKNS